MDHRVEELMEKQMKWQKITAILLGLLLILLLGVGLYLGKIVNEMTTALEQTEDFLAEATEKLEELDVEGINHAFSEVDGFVDSMDGVVKQAEDMAETIDGVTKQFEAIGEGLDNLKSKFWL